MQSQAVVRDLEIPLEVAAYDDPLVFFGERADDQPEPRPLAVCSHGERILRTVTNLRTAIITADVTITYDARIQAALQAIASLVADEAPPGQALARAERFGRQAVLCLRAYARTADELAASRGGR